MKKYTRFKADMVNCKEEYTDKEEYNMKKYVKSAVNVHNIKQMPTVDDFINRYFTPMVGVNGERGSNDFWFDTYAARSGNDIILAVGDDPLYFVICKNATKYIDEFFAVTSSEEQRTFEEAHPDVKEEWISDIDKIFL